ncbi:MAG TPA: hypothetical protein DEQ40_19085 [Oxalobacteraceae bacterium]|jgi:hypothetical protein|nr:hypothetical protein [Oxalobacteraceae bacterium]
MAGFTLNVAETLTLSDTIQRGAARRLTDTVSLVDTISKGIARGFSESVSLTDLWWWVRSHVLAPAASRTFVIPAGAYAAGSPVTKNAAAVLDYTFDWTAYLGPDTILVSDWTVTGLGVVLKVNTATTATVVLSGGAPGVTYQVVNTVTFGSGHVDIATLAVTIR